ncbi:MAG: hypothetical protein KAW66_14320 [Candidatus Lokiarchaeota archaeon]|nr:hypothetical protein [Candidatus Lokiarchaeota archaeon]
MNKKRHSAPETRTTHKTPRTNKINPNTTKSNEPQKPTKHNTVHTKNGSEGPTAKLVNNVREKGVLNKKKNQKTAPKITYNTPNARYSVSFSPIIKHNLPIQEKEEQRK